MAEKTRAEDLFDEFKKKALDDIKSGTEDFDRNLLTFSSGALGLSLAFIKDVVPLGRAVWTPCLFLSWVAFALCIVVTMASFQVSIRALSGSLSYARAYYLEGDEEAFDRHLKTLWCRAIDWCTLTGSALFVAGLLFTILFVGVNVRRAERMSKEDVVQAVVLGDLGKSLKPSAMTPVSGGNEGRGVQSVPMTPNNTGAGVKPGPMTPAPTQGPTQPAPGNTPAPDKQ